MSIAALAASGRAQEIEQQPPPPHPAHISLAAPVDRFLAVNLANVLVAIKPAPFEQGHERANIPAAIFHDFNVGVRIGLLDRLDQPLATGDGRHDQIEGNRQAPERAGDIGPSVLIVDMDDDRRLDAAATIGLPRAMRSSAPATRREAQDG